MTDPAEQVDGMAEEIAAGVEVEFEPVPGGKMRLRSLYEGDVLERGEYAEVFRGTHRGRTNSGEFINNTVEAVREVDGLDAEEIKGSLKSWFTEMSELREEEQMAFEAEYVQEIIEGTELPVKAYLGEKSTWEIELTYAGRTNTLQFTAAEMTGSGGAVLEEKIANYYLELIDVEPEDWETIRDYWNEHTVEVANIDETAEDAVADRFVNKLTDAVRPLESLEQVATEPAGAWYDADNTAGCDDVPAGEPVLWVQDRFYVDKLEAIGKQIEYKGQLTKDLIADDTLYGPNVRRTWDGTFDRRTQMFPFDPRELGIDEDDVAPAPEDNTDEVDI
jgi:hypothetical protein